MEEIECYKTLRVFIRVVGIVLLCMTGCGVYNAKQDAETTRECLKLQLDPVKCGVSKPYYQAGE